MVTVIMGMANNQCRWAKSRVLGVDRTQNSSKRCCPGCQEGGRALLEVCASWKTSPSSSPRRQQQHHISIREWAEMHIAAQAGDKRQAGSKWR